MSPLEPGERPVEEWHDNGPGRCPLCGLTMAGCHKRNLEGARQYVLEINGWTRGQLQNAAVISVVIAVVLWGGGVMLHVPHSWLGAAVALGVLIGASVGTLIQRSRALAGLRADVYRFGRAGDPDRDWAYITTRTVQS